MRNILVLGAGRSSSSLIAYLLDHARQGQWQLMVGDFSEKAAREKTGNHPHGKAIAFDINNTEEAAASIASADLVISLLPANLHPLVAIRCLEQKKHLLNASYVSDEMKGFHEEALAQGLLFLNECGLDPGIDHMSAMQVIDRIREGGGKLESFESFTGGLIAPETDPQNPWRYKFTWNPRNVVMAGQNTAKYLQEGKYKYIAYQQLFKRTTPVTVPGYGEYEGYANRDSLKYRETYQLNDIRTMLRGTLRNKGFCAAWDVLVQLGCCEDTYEMEGVSLMTHRSFIESFLPDKTGKSCEEKIAAHFKLALACPEMTNLKWSGLFSDERVGLQKGTPAQVLECILDKKWKLDPQDKDQIVMWHRFVYEQDKKKKQIQASLIATGTDSVYTAMAKTVGLPLAISAKLLLEGKINVRGVVIPTLKEIYNPVLEELKLLGVELHELHSS
jgi:saccharopine dehydrogenase-like NADP-dependent oxidoreductase